MSKRFGFCEAGCKREVVGREEYDAKMAAIELYLNDLRQEMIAMEDRVSEWKSAGHNAEVSFGTTYRVCLNESGTEWDANIIISYTFGGTATSRILELPAVNTHKKYLDIEFVDFTTDGNGGMGVLTYKIDGVEQVLEWNHDGLVIELTRINIYAENYVYYYYFGDNADFIENAVNVEMNRLLDGDY